MKSVRRKQKQILSKIKKPQVSHSSETSSLLQSPDEFIENLNHHGSEISYGSLLDSDSPSVDSSPSESAFSRASSLAPLRPTALSWKHLNVYVKDEKEMCSCFRKPKVRESDKNVVTKDGMKQVLFEVSGAVRPGQIVAIIGASGAGKTSLLNCLTYRNVRNYKVEGEILVNGTNIGKAITSISSYVQQQDLYIGALTVREHLNFQALLRLPNTYSWSQKLHRAHEVLVELGLKRCQDTVIGIPGQTPGISGGEKKRLAFASEALTNPAIFFCDEPTTGLDSYMAEQVVLFLKKMAQHGKTVLCTIHQPTSEVYALFDLIYIVGEGRTIFLGSPAACLAFFKDAGYPCPRDFNPADYFIQTLAIVPGHEKECKERLDTLASAFQNSSSLFKMEQEIKTDGAIRGSSVVSDTGSLFEAKSYRGAGWFMQFCVLLWRTALFSIRTKRLSFVRLTQKAIIGVLIGLIYFQTIMDPIGISNINGALFFVLMHSSMSTTMVILRNLPSEFPILAREHHNGMYAVSSYYWSKIVCYLPLFTIDGILFVCITYFMIGLKHTIDAFFCMLLIIALVEQTSAAFGTMLSVVAPSFPAAVVLAAPILTLVRLTTGMMANVGTLPVYISWIQYLSWWRYSFEAALINQWRGFESTDCETATAANLSCPTGDDILRQRSFAAQYFSRDLVMEVVLMAAFYVIGYLVLCVKVYRAR